MRRLALLLVILLTLSLLPLLCSLPSLWAQGQLIPGNRTLAGTLNAGPSTGTGAAYVLTLNPAITAYVPDQVFMFRAHVDNTGPATLAVNGAGAKPLKKWTGAVLNDLAVGDIKAGQQVTAAYDGTVMQVTSLIGASAGAGGALGPSGTLQASDGSGHLAAFGGDACVDPAAFVRGVSPTGQLTCALPTGSSGGGSIAAHVLVSQAHASTPNAVNLGVLPSGIPTVTTSGGIAAVSTVPAPVGRLLGTTDVQEVTNTAVSPRIIPLSMTTNPLTFDVSTFDEAVISDLLQDTRINNPTGTARPGQWLRLKVHTTVPRALVWGTVGTTSAWTGFLLPTSTTGGTTEDLFLWEYNARTGLWEIIYNSQWVNALGPTGVTPGSHPCPASITVTPDGRITAITDGTLPCGSDGTASATTAAGAEGDVQLNRFAVLGADSGNMVVDPVGHVLAASNLHVGTLQTYQELSDTRGHTATLSTVSRLTMDRHVRLPDEDGELCVKGGSCFTAAPGGGDVTGPAASVDGEVALFSGGTGKIIKRATGTGIAKLAAGVQSTVAAPTGAIVGDTDAQTLTNKRLPPRVTTLSSAAANPSFQCDFSQDQCEIQATVGSAGNLTMQAPTGTMQNGEMRLALFLCSTQQSFIWDPIFIPSPNVPLPASCPAGVSNWFAVGFRWSTSLNKFQILASN